MLIEWTCPLRIGNGVTEGPRHVAKNNLLLLACFPQGKKGPHRTVNQTLFDYYCIPKESLLVYEIDDAPAKERLHP
jgi:hypothetical protein